MHFIRTMLWLRYWPAFWLLWQRMPGFCLPLPTRSGVRSGRVMLFSPTEAFDGKLLYDVTSSMWKIAFIKVDCTDDCQPMCMCNEGFHRADNGECVPCSNEPICGLNEHFEECGNQCRDEICPCPPDVECDEEMSWTTLAKTDRNFPANSLKVVNV